LESLVDYLNEAFGGSGMNDGVLKYFYEQLYGKYNPDINGYTLVFMMPPDLSGYRVNKSNSLYNQIDPSSYFGEVGQFVTFASVDFTPPQSQVNTENISSRTGAIPYATEVSESETCSVTYIENSDLDIYMMHHLWIEYIREVLEGAINPADEYLDPDSDNFGAIDYGASLYVVKYRPDMKTITFAAKCMGIFPQSIPTKELIGSRTSNELVTLPFTYFCTAYREATSMEFDNWILSEVEMLASKFSLSWQSVLGLATNSFFKVLGISENILGQQISTITQIPNRIVQAGLNTATEIIGKTTGTVLKGIGKITPTIGRFPKSPSFKIDL
jgi:hypothetical protein